MAILLAVEQWRSYLQHAEFTIYTDQRSLIHLSDQRLNTPWQQKVFTKLLGLQYKIVYKQGVSNRVADVLLRRPHYDHQLCVVSTCDPSWITVIVEGYNSDPSTLHILTKLAVSSNSVPHFSLQNGLLRFNGRLWIGTNKSLQPGADPERDCASG